LGDFCIDAADGRDLPDAGELRSAPTPGGTVRRLNRERKARCAVTVCSTVTALLLAVTAQAAGPSPYALANRCFALRALTVARFVDLAGGGGYEAAAANRSQAVPFFLKPTALGTFMLYDRGGELLAVGAGQGGQGAAVTRTGAPGPSAQWRPAVSPGGAFTLTSTADGDELAVASASGALVLAPAGSAGRSGRFRFLADRRCATFPEAQVGAFGRPRSSRNHDGTVFGFADYHLEVTSSFRAGGDVIYGEDFDPFGITVALSTAGDEQVHGANGTEDVTGNLLRHGTPTGTHDNHGWPTFAGWPVYNTYTHQQDYWVWLERAWRAGLRLIVVQTSEDEELCNIEPVRSHSCNEAASIELQVQNLHMLQAYIDAQFGGPGRGFFRLVYTPRQARKVAEQGKLAAVIGVESSNPFGCSEYQGEPQCTRADIDRGLAQWWRLGIRGFFPLHWVDNAFAGAAFEGGATGTFLNLLNKYETGHYFAAEPCPLPGEGEQMLSAGHYFSGADPLSQSLDAIQSMAVPTYPPGPLCNARGLTDLGRYLIQRMIAYHMMIDVDHLSEKARESVLTIAEQSHYPLISSHTGTGGEWPAQDLRRLYALGGLATITGDLAPNEIKKLLELRRFRSRRFYFGVGLGTDTGGFGPLPGPRPDAAKHPLRYPFKSYDGRVTFVRQRTGQRVFDLNTDGAAHYGLIADMLADMEQQPGGHGALATLFRSTEAYLEAWQRAFDHR
jgi:microsomal dipeptidase-like Zn-dependent dipeptidase